MFIDTHAHLDDPSYNEAPISEVIKRAHNASVEYIIAPGINLPSSNKVKEISDRFDEVYFSAGIHCHNALEFTKNALWEISNLLDNPKGIAVGEVGLDYHYDFSPRDVQMRVLENFLELAITKNKPMILHCREAEEDLWKMLKAYEGKVNGVIHCYTGSAEYAEKFVSLGFYIGFTGVITFKNSSSIREAVMVVPDDKILTETDSPYMTPIPYRGKRNEPMHIPLIAEKLASIKEKSTEEFYPMLLNNARECFGVDWGLNSKN
jgi:TatD DNase family protein